MPREKIPREIFSGGGGRKKQTSLPLNDENRESEKGKGRGCCRKKMRENPVERNKFVYFKITARGIGRKREANIKEIVENTKKKKKKAFGAEGG